MTEYLADRLISSLLYLGSLTSGTFVGQEVPARGVEGSNLVKRVSYPP